MKNKMYENAKRLWAQTQVRVWPENYFLLSYAPEQFQQALAAAATTASFCAVLKERDEVSITVDEKTLQALPENFTPRAVAGPYRVITFDLNLDLSVCGYFALAAERLAQAGISLVPQCAYLKDHVLIQAEKTAQAVQALQALITWARDTK